jgi:hypothetical protein
MRYHLHRMSSLIVFATILLLATATFVLASDQAWQVIVYEHADYQGKSLVYSVQPGMCQRLEPDLSKYQMNDKISSVKVGKNVMLQLFEHKNYSGESVKLYETVQSLSNIVTKWSKFKFNDKASSLLVWPKHGVAPAGVYLRGATFSKQTFYPASETCGAVNYPHLVHNDYAYYVDIIRAQGKCELKATIYEHADFKGKSQSFTSGPSGIQFTIGKDLFGKASSLKMEIIGKCPVRTQ